MKKKLRKGLLISRCDVITQTRLKEVFCYENGKLFWKIRTSRCIHIGDEAGSKRTDGYRMIYVDGKHYLTHRLIFLYHHGYLPKQIDHIDMNRNNNLIENLRGCSNGQNSFNKKIQKNNKSGVKGVYWCNNYKKWSAHCWINYKNYNLGYFTDLDEAKKIVQEFREKHHGEFVNHG